MKCRSQKNMSGNLFSRMKRGLFPAALLSLTAALVQLCMTAVCENETENVICFEDVIYLGVLNYGSEETTAQRKDDFRYLFESDEGELIFRIRTD